MKTIILEQNSEEWHKLRKAKIGASDANIIMGESKFMTELDLYKQKTGKEICNDDDQNFIQEKGHRIERKMRPIMEFLYDTDLPGLTVLSDDYPFLMCSLDGYSNDKGFNWECKYIGQDEFDIVNGGEFLPKFKPQIQQQLMLTGAAMCILTVATENGLKPGDPDYNKDFPFKYAYIEVVPDHEYMKNELLPKLVKFDKRISDKDAPEATDADVADFSDNEEMIGLIAEYREALIQVENFEKGKADLLGSIAEKLMKLELELKSWTKKEDDAKKKIFKLSKVKLAECNGVKITRTKARVTKEIDYISFVADKKLEIEDKYKKIDYKKFIKDGKHEIEEKYIGEKIGKAGQKITLPKD